MTTTTILEQDPGHQVWIDGISQSCDLERPSIFQNEPVELRDKTVWHVTWVFREAGSAITTNYGVRIEYAGRYMCLVRGPMGHVTMDHLVWFPSAGQILTMVRLAGFDWALA